MSFLVGEDVTLDYGEHAGGGVGDDGAAVALAGQGDPAQLVEEKISGPAMLRMPFSGAPAATSATALATSLEAIDWIGVAGNRTVSPSAVQDRTASMNCVARTIE